ncbi:MAG TPA: ferritin-like domain-containing protein, partial [Myxococcaceae bacterium]|nr:ferritin-like domain-containing protein [Myxococcaceae bacterium]
MKQSELPDRLRRIVGEAWAFRWKVELEAEIRFARLAGRLQPVGALPSIVELASRAASDERRHASICAALAKEYGHPGIDESAVTASEIAPRRLSEKQRVLYEVVAACCITETESVSVLTTLVNSVSS